MADTIKIGNLDISAFKVGSDDCKVYLGDTLLYPHSTSFKWKATFTGGTTSSAQCDSTSAITDGEIGGEAINVTSVEVGNCVTEIGMGAFSNYIRLSSITLSDSVTTIGEEAFYYTEGLYGITIPDSVTTIGELAFYYSGISYATIGSGVTTIGARAFENCAGLITMDIPDNVTSIGNEAFKGCYQLTSLNIGSGITSIGESAFIALNRLTGVTINATTPPALGYDAFVYTNCPIYVPCDSVNAYKAASDWSDYASRIQAIPNS